ncbi:multidrug MFS transporter [Jeongeupia sp. HS-3]|uniref:epoxide hydrolase family protein n=1 Tax=Jeongeupia sp. HS-3 TaxID=1009682 RepID=UPI0018A3C17E|nr:epoxide hydrolase family protein [Jeongeupia sp. HS-3]BCL77041.1 multidrug MFS transporter [Jeongeupia sp. HS-3]
MSALSITPFTVAIPEATLGDLRQRLAHTRHAAAIDSDGWSAGMPPQVLRTLLAHWQDFDWRAAETAINAYPAFRTEIDGVGLHFVHVRGEGPNCIPLILTNGWPSCFLELLPLIPLLTKSVNGLAFDIVIPSLPGYGFSDQPLEPGMNITRIAALWARLMAGLGYARFVAHGSDMGAGVVDRLRANHAGQLIAIHMINVFSGYPADGALAPEEAAYLAAAGQWRAAESAYAMLHASKPQTIAAALNDTPAGLAAWIGEKFHGWRDGGLRMDDRAALDALCAVLTVYWATQTIGSSQRLYREAFADAGAMSPPPRHGVPVGVAVFPADILPAPRTWAQRWFDRCDWQAMPRGGHFPGFETPELLADELRRFVAALPAG